MDGVILRTDFTIAGETPRVNLLLTWFWTGLELGKGSRVFVPKAFGQCRETG